MAMLEMIGKFGIEEKKTTVNIQSQMDFSNW